MIPRYQRILFYSLAVIIFLVATFTIYARQKAQDRVTAATDALPYIEPVNAQTESVTLYLANDAEGSIASTSRDVALPQEPSLRARALIERLVAEYSQPGSPHLLKSGTAADAVDDVFLLKLPLASPKEATSSETGLLAVINLRGSFADSHPSGVEVEDLTIQSILGTLHANLPEITQVRFLVDGQRRETLAGHADLTRTYTANDVLTQPTQPTENFQQ